MKQIKYTDHPSVIRRDYKGRSVRFRPIENEDIVYIAVADIINLFMCHYIDWKALNSACASCAKIIFYKGKMPPIYAIKTYDLPALCRLGCNKIISKRNQEIIDWITDTVNIIKSQSKENTSNENSIQIFNNPQFGQIRMAGTPDDPLFCLADICKAVELKNPSSVKSRLDEGDVQLIDFHALNYTEGDIIGNTKANFINESAFYDVILQSNSPRVKPFRKWVTSEVLPSIRKHGAYMTQATLQKALSSPDFLIQLATQLKEEQQKRMEVEQKNVILIEDNNYKKSVIEGLTEGIPLADMRQRITQIIRKGGVTAIKDGYNLLYNEFDKKYHINLSTRMNNIMYAGSKLDYIEKELKMLPELYCLTCKLFESQYESLMESWGKTVKRAQGCRN